jgi:hypothetical protein
MKLSKKKTLITIICTCGVCASAYGMANSNDTIFLVGLVLIVSGYLFIRKELKSSTEGDSRKDC